MSSTKFPPPGIETPRKKALDSYCIYGYNVCIKTLVQSPETPAQTPA